MEDKGRVESSPPGGHDRLARYPPSECAVPTAKPFALTALRSIVCLIVLIAILNIPRVALAQSTGLGPYDGPNITIDVDSMRVLSSNRAFDAWYPALATDGVDIRYLRSMMKGLLGGVSKVESIGYGPINTVCMLTDGSLEPLDVIRITGNGATATNMNIFDHSFEDMKSCPVWREAYDASMRPCAACLSCDYVQACGGGFLPHRYSAERGYDNPSVYCQDIKGLLHHIWDRIAPEVTIQSQDGSRKRLLSEAFDA